MLNPEKREVSGLDVIRGAIIDASSVVHTASCSSSSFLAHPAQIL